MNLYISKIPSYQACELVKNYTKMIVMKIPNNFNIKKLASHHFILFTNAMKDRMESQRP